MSLTYKITGLAVLFIAVIITGVFLAKSGKPYNSILFNVHKLISLATVVLGGIWVYNIYRAAGTGTGILALVILTALLFIILFVTGGMLNLEKSYHNVLTIIHKAASPLSLIATVILFYLLLKK